MILVLSGAYFKKKRKKKKNERREVHGFHKSDAFFP